jgi:hypothetical protein
MQHMQDKDFDQLFKDRFEDAEIQPSAGLWSNIKKEIKPKQQRKLPIFWMAAASVLVTVGVAVFFNSPKKIQLHGSTAIAVNAVPIETKDKHEPESAKTTVNDAITTAHKATLNPKSGKSVPSRTPALPNERKTLLALQPNAAPTHLIDMKPAVTSTETAIKLTQSAIKTAETTIHPEVELPAVEVAVASTGKPNTNAITEEASAINTEDAETAQSGRTRIRNAADLVNFVVDKLDKREQKILEFRTDDDDNTSLVAINIGPFKMNPRKHK